MLSRVVKGAATLDFTYGADGQRLRAVRGGLTNTITTTYTYDGLNLLALHGVYGSETWHW